MMIAVFPDTTYFIPVAYMYVYILVYLFKINNSHIPCAGLELI